MWEFICVLISITSKYQTKRTIYGNNGKHSLHIIKYDKYLLFFYVRDLKVSVNRYTIHIYLIICAVRSFNRCVAFNCWAMRSWNLFISNWFFFTLLDASLKSHRPRTTSVQNLILIDDYYNYASRISYFNWKRKLTQLFI